MLRTEITGLMLPLFDRMDHGLTLEEVRVRGHQVVHGLHREHYVFWVPLLYLPHQFFRRGVIERVQEQFGRNAVDDLLFRGQ